MEWLTDSVAFGYVLKLSMRLGKRKKKKMMKPINYKNMLAGGILFIS
jgi:hypothetical protein